MSRGGNRSHPPTLLRIVERTLREECRLREGERLLLAVSGGGDSTAMLHVMAKLAPKFGIGLFAHGVDHGLRPEASSELELVAAHAKALGIEYHSTKIDVAAGGNLQARARQARYTVLEQRALELGGALITTAHHADDRAETVMLRIMRGSGLLGLGVLAARRGRLLRPLIRARRSDIQAHLLRHELVYASDPSNTNTHYLRVKVRREILPGLVEASPGIVEHLCALADQALAARCLDSEDSGAERSASATGLDTTGLDATGLDATGLDATGLDATGLDATGLDATGLDTTGLDTTGGQLLAGFRGGSQLGRRQQLALTRAIELAQVGFELPLSAGLAIRLVRNHR